MSLSPLEAYDAVMRFARERGQWPLRLAMHAAVPQSFRPLFLHLIKLNFLVEIGNDPSVESDVLLAPFCEEIGAGYYQFDRQARALLLENLQAVYASENNPRVYSVAGLLLAYLQDQERSIDSTQDRLSQSYIDVQRWIALSVLDPEGAAQQLAAALNQVAPTGTSAVRLQVGGLVSLLAGPLLRYPMLADYALGVQALERGEFDKARQLLAPLEDAEVEVGSVKLRRAASLLDQWGATAAAAKAEPVMPASPQPKQVPTTTESDSGSSPEAPAVKTSKPSHGPGRLDAENITVGDAKIEAQRLKKAVQTGPQIPNIFVSSTYTELAEYRKAAAEAVSMAGCQPVLMESLGILERPPVEESLAEIKRADAVIVIVGETYGWIPPDQAKGEQKSITWIEYEEAYRLGKKFFVVFNEEIGRTVERRSAEFKKMLKSRHEIMMVVTPDDLRSVLTIHLREWRRGRSQLTLISIDELADREKGRNEGGDLLVFPGSLAVVVNSVNPLEQLDSKFAALVFNNMQAGARYDYFYGDFDNNIGPTINLIVNIATTGAIRPFLSSPQPLQVSQEDLDTLRDRLRVMRHRLGIHFRRRPPLQFCVHNANSEETAVCYLRREDGFVRWADGRNAKEISDDLLASCCEADRDAVIFHSTIDVLLNEKYARSEDGEYKLVIAKRREQLLQLIRRRFPPELSDDVAETCLGT